MAKRKGQLVCQHLEGISRRVLQSYPDIVRDLSRGRHGIYALYRRDRLYYLGLATDLRRRLKEHLRDQHAQTWDRFSLYLTVGDDHINEIESLFLRISKPHGNKVTPSLANSQNLLNDVRSQIKTRQNLELEDIAPTRRATVKAREKRKAKPVVAKRTGPQPVLAQYASKRFPIRFSYKSKTYRATGRRDGTIFDHKGKIFTSPSGAAKAITGRESDGWHCWQYERAPGDWVPLKTLRE
jgi:hypothetical protein